MQTILTQEFIQEAKERSKHFPVEGFLAGQGAVSPKFMLIGEAPGEVEANHTGTPFSGRAGKELDKMLELLEVERSAIYITSPFRSRPYKEIEQRNKKTGEIQLKKRNRPPNQKELLAHAPLLDYELATIQPPFILTMGNIGLKRLLGNKVNVGQVHGTLIKSKIQKLSKENPSSYQWSKETYCIFPTFHPASVFYNRKLEETIKEDLLIFKALLNEKI